MKVEETWVLVKISLMKDKELYKRDWEIEGLVNFICKHGLCRLQGRASFSASCVQVCNWLSHDTHSCIFLHAANTVSHSTLPGHTSKVQP